MCSLCSEYPGCVQKTFLGDSAHVKLTLGSYNLACAGNRQECVLADIDFIIEDICKALALQ